MQESEKQHKDCMWLGTVASAPGFLLVLWYLATVLSRLPRQCRAIFCDPHHWQVFFFGLGFAGIELTVLPSSKLPRLARVILCSSVTLLGATLVGFFAASREGWRRLWLKNPSRATPHRGAG